LQVSRANLPPDVPLEAVEFLDLAGYFDDDRLRVGDVIPRLQLYTADGAPLTLQSFFGHRPVVLVFGSYT